MRLRPVLLATAVAAGIVATAPGGDQAAAMAPEITQCIVPNPIVQAGDSLFAGICFKNPGPTSTAFEYLVNYWTGWCAVLQDTIVLGPGDSVCVGQSCRVPADQPCGLAGTVVVRVREVAEGSSFDGCDGPFSVLNDVCVYRTCPLDTVVSAGAAFQRRFRFHNCGPDPETFDFTVGDTQGWSTSGGGTITLAPQEETPWLTVNVQVPFTSIDCVLQDDVVLRVHPQNCPEDTFTCESSVFAVRDVTAQPALQWNTGTRIASLAFPGDLNADGYGDFVVGTFQSNVLDPGQALVYYGGPAVDTVPDRTLTGVSQYDGFGGQVAGVVDFNSDGFPDLAVAASGNASTVYIYFGGAAFDSVADRVLTGASSFGSSLASLGDINGDGNDDLAVGAPDVAMGRVYLYFGGPAADTVVDLTIDSPGDLRSAVRIAGGADVDGDGWRDFCVAAQKTSTSQYAVYMYRGGPALDGTPDLVLASSLPNFQGGLLCADLNRDGFGDIADAAPDGGVQQTGGRVSIYFGGPELDDVADRVLGPGIPWEYFGLELALAGDLDGDGSMDLAGSSQGSRVWLYRAGSSLDTVCDGLLDAPRRLAGGRDVSGDGHPDLLVGDQFNWLRLYTTLDQSPTDVGDREQPSATPQRTALGACVEMGPAGTRIAYEIAASGARARLEIFDVAGRRVRTVFDGSRAAGAYSSIWDHRDDQGTLRARGVYLVRLHSSDVTATRKIVVLRP